MNSDSLTVRRRRCFGDRDHVLKCHSFRIQTDNTTGLRVGYRLFFTASQSAVNATGFICVSIVFTQEVTSAKKEMNNMGKLFKNCINH
jgi:hypothetical protein